MRILFFSDTHGNDKWHKELVEKSRMADVVVCAGDFTIFENNIRQVLELLNSIHKPILLVHGNHETSSSTIREIHDLKNIHFIHKSSYIMGDVAFFGYGGGGFSTTEEKFDKAAETFLKELDKLNKDMRIILVTHAPPYNTSLDDLGYPVGVINFRKFIEQYQPILAVSGHIHENFGEEDTIGNCRMLNLGPKGKILDI